MKRELLEEMRADGLSTERRARFDAARRRSEPARGLELALAWSQALQVVLGGRLPTREPWRGRCFRL